MEIPCKVAAYGRYGAASHDGRKPGRHYFTIELPVHVVRQPVKVVTDNEMDNLFAMLPQRYRTLLWNFMPEGHMVPRLPLGRHQTTLLLAALEQIPPFMCIMDERPIALLSELQTLLLASCALVKLVDEFPCSVQRCGSDVWIQSPCYFNSGRIHINMKLDTLPLYS